MLDEVFGIIENVPIFPQEVSLCRTRVPKIITTGPIRTAVALLSLKLP